MSAGLTRWFPRHITPVRPGIYRCAVRLTSAQRVLFLWDLEWDGHGFLVPVPMVVYQWRGMTKKAHDAATKEQP